MLSSSEIINYLKLNKKKFKQHYNIDKIFQYTDDLENADELANDNESFDATLR